MRSRIGTGIGLGLYAAGLGSLALYAVEHAGGLELPAHPLFLGVVVGLGATGVGALAVHKLEALHSDRLAAQVGALPVLGGVGAVLLALAGTPDALGVGVIGVGAGLLGTFVLRRSALDHRARRLAGRAAPLATLPEQSGRPSDRRIRLLNAVVGGLFLLVAAGGYVGGRPWWPLEFVAGLGMLLAALGAGRRLAATEAGILFESRFASRLLEWDDLAGYYLEDELVLLRSEWWYGDVVFDAEEVDAEAVESIDRFLPRSKTRTIPASGLVPVDEPDSEVPGD